MVAANFKMTSYFLVQLCLMSFVLNIFLVGYCAAESDEYYGKLSFFSLAFLFNGGSSSAITIHPIDSKICM